MAKLNNRNADPKRSSAGALTDARAEVSEDVQEVLR